MFPILAEFTQKYGFQVWFDKVLHRNKIPGISIQISFIKEFAISNKRQIYHVCNCVYWTLIIGLWIIISIAPPLNITNWIFLYLQFIFFAFVFSPHLSCARAKKTKASVLKTQRAQSWSWHHCPRKLWTATKKLMKLSFWCHFF